MTGNPGRSRAWDHSLDHYDDGRQVTVIYMEKTDGCSKEP